MTVPAGQTPIITYAYTGPGDYDFTFRVFKESDLLVTYVNTSGERSLLTIGAVNDYTIALLEEGRAGGVCTLTYDATDGFLEIRRSIAKEQPTDWVNNSPFNAELLEIDLDRAIMIIQEMQVQVDGAYVSSNWRGDWIPNHPYYIRDLIVDHSNGNIYTALLDHVSGTNLATDIADGNWALLIDIEAVETARLDAEQSAAEALSSENASKTSENNAETSETQAGISEANAAILAQETANCRQDAYDSAVAAANSAASINLPAIVPGDAGKFLEVNVAEDGYDHVDPPNGTFTGLTDTPSSYVGQAGKATIVNATEDGLEFGDASGGGGLEWNITVTPVVGVLGQGYIMDVSSADGIINLPPGQEGETVGAMQLGTFDPNQTYFIKFVPNGTENIHGVNQELVLDTQSAELVYSDATNGWQVQEATPVSGGNPLIANKPFLHVQDQKTTGTNGGTSSSGDNHKELNTTLINEITGCTSPGIGGGSDNEVTLPAGEYYLECVSPARHESTATGNHSILRISDSSDNILMRGSNILDGAGSSDLTNSIAGRLTLNNTTSIKVIHWLSTGRTTDGLGGAQGTVGPYEVYTDLRIWRLDQEIHTPVVALPPNTVVAGVPVTGNIYGLEYSMNAGSPTDTLDIGAGSTMDDTSTEEIVYTGGTLTLSSPTINTIYNLFITKTSGVVSPQYDTDVDGANLVVDYKRWIGFVRTNASGHICSFELENNRLLFSNSDENIISTNIGAAIGAAVTVDHTDYIPENRIEHILYGTRGYTATLGTLATTMDQVNCEHVIGKANNTHTKGTINAWRSSSYVGIEYIPYSSSRRFFADAANMNLLLHGVTLKR